MIKKILIVLIGTILPTISYAQQNSQQPTYEKTEQTQSDSHQKDYFCWKGQDKYTIGFIYEDKGIKQECRLIKDMSKDALNPDYYSKWVEIN
ncbi:hypothetical protein CIN_09660 [Commensalibacter intestini A911]|uniref:Secreted protein n=1 Tax=Commensalibacter intestini A911 TaxID=1088868 RepID=G6F020_9PROT|nr:hypothetical protein [Commensalibacter intestini]EHD14102.1 hypothetical protein CIN_09660 [Commensalibacter intestini A911]